MADPLVTAFTHALSYIYCIKLLNVHFGLLGEIIHLSVKREQFGHVYRDVCCYNFIIHHILVCLARDKLYLESGKNVTVL